jgi:hypothetical protein
MTKLADFLARLAFLPADPDQHAAHARAANPEVGNNDPVEDQFPENPKFLVTLLPVCRVRDEPDVRRLLNSYSPHAR